MKVATLLPMDVEMIGDCPYIEGGEVHGNCLGVEVGVVHVRKILSSQQTDHINGPVIALFTEITLWKNTVAMATKIYFWKASSVTAASMAHSREMIQVLLETAPQAYHFLY